MESSVGNHFRYRPTNGSRWAGNRTRCPAGSRVWNRGGGRRDGKPPAPGLSSSPGPLGLAGASQGAGCCPRGEGEVNPGRGPRGELRGADAGGKSGEGQPGCAPKDRILGELRLHRWARPGPPRPGDCC